jgi:radical SAM protein with 4Fe4S-binding SPASM domain
LRLAAPDVNEVSCSHAGSGSGAKARVVAKYLGGCGAGRTYVCVEPNGNITPCVYLPHRVMGNVRQKPLMEIFRNSVFWEILNDRSRRLHHCEVCAFKNYCGGCRARADAYLRPAPRRRPRLPLQPEALGRPRRTGCGRGGPGSRPGRRHEDHAHTARARVGIAD